MPDVPIMPWRREERDVEQGDEKRRVFLYSAIPLLALANVLIFANKCSCIMPNVASSEHPGIGGTASELELRSWVMDVWSTERGGLEGGGEEGRDETRNVESVRPAAAPG